METQPLTDIMNEMIADLITRYRSKLQANNKVASGRLYNSVQLNDIEEHSGELVGTIQLADHWKYVEKGRSRGKFPPIDNIINWLKVKNLPRPDKMTLQQQAYLIARKISLEGIPETNLFEEALNETQEAFRSRLENATRELIIKNIKTQKN